MENLSTGGYKILDLSAYGPFTSTVAVTVPGIIDFIRTNISKPILVTGVVVSGDAVPAFFANLRKKLSQSGWAYVCYYGDKFMTIYNDDRIVFEL